VTVGLSAAPSGAAAGRMDRIYRHQRHIYDVTRKYFLLGRDRLIDRLHPSPGDCVLEIGCGTARNLVRAARRYPHALFFGVDISAEMLATADRAIARRRLASRIRLARADATAFDPAALFGSARFERVFVSYSLSMIPEWRSAVHLAYALLAQRGEMHVVDFGDQSRLPVWFSAGLQRWLARFDVTPCDALEYELAILAGRAGAALDFQRPYLGYAQHAVIRRID
jgi:S-adenosylmethionine-diacylgycerolhomoserine-N-methlytransferase